MNEELQILVEPIVPGVIRIGNLEKIKEDLNRNLEEYRHAQYTDQTIGFAKKAVAGLRRLKKEANDIKIAAKKEYMKPCVQFEAQVRELLEMIDEPILLIDRQVKEYKAGRREERRTEIRELYEAAVAGSPYAEYLPLEKMYDSGWENLSTTKKSIEEAMTAHVEGTAMEVESIRTMVEDPEAQAYALQQYKAGSTVVEAMKRAKEYLDMLAKRTERERLGQEAAARREVEKSAAEAFLAADPTGEEDSIPFPINNLPPMYSGAGPAVAEYTIQGTDLQLDMLEAFVAGHGMQILRRVRGWQRPN